MESDADFSQDELSLADLLRFLRRGFLSALLVGVLFAVAVYLFSHSRQPVYQAEATLLAAQPNASASFGVSLVTAPWLDANAYSAAARSNPVLQGALKQLGGSAPSQQAVADLGKRLTVSTEENRESSLIHLSIRDTSPGAAAREANAVAKALKDWDVKRATTNLDTIISALTSQIAALESQLTQLGDAPPDQAQRNGITSLIGDKENQLSSAKALKNSAVGQLQTLEPALPPLNPSSPRPLRNAVLAFILGVVLSYGLQLLRDSLDTSLRDVDDIAATSGLPVLAEFPRLRGGSRRLPPETGSYLRTNLLYATVQAHPKVFLISSAVAEEGKTSVALALAESFARGDYRTLLIDADLRKPTLAQEHKLTKNGQASLTDYLQNPRQPLAPTNIPVNARQGFDLIPTFKAAHAPSEILASGFRVCLENWREHYDVIVIDSAPLLPVADTLTIAPLCTGTVLVASLQDSDRKQVHGAIALLQRLGISLLGVAATKVTEGRSGSRYGYGYGYGYGESETASTRSVPLEPSPNDSIPASQEVHH
jgi:non-specific protein-tyrosine kinase